jgi:hypothetical protein
VSDATYELKLGARVWRLPPLPFGVIKTLQPRLLRRNFKLNDGKREDFIFRLDEEAMEDLLGIVEQAVNAAGPPIAREALEALPFTASDLIAAQSPIMLACGLTPLEAVEEAAEAPKAQTSTSTNSSPA